MTPYLIFPKIITHFHNENLRHKHDKPFHNFCNWLADAMYLHTDGQVFWENIKQENKKTQNQDVY